LAVFSPLPPQAIANVELRSAAAIQWLFIMSILWWGNFKDRAVPKLSQGEQLRDARTVSRIQN